MNIKRIFKYNENALKSLKIFLNKKNIFSKFTNLSLNFFYYVHKKIKHCLFRKKIKFKKRNKPFVSIIIPIYNNCSYTMKCLESIYFSKDKTSYEIIIADDNSSDESYEKISQIKGIRYIKNNKNIGYVKNCNNAAKQAKGEYLYFLNNDTQVGKKWLKELLYVFRNKADAGCVGSQILNNDSSIQECGALIFNDCQSLGIGIRKEKDSYYYLSTCDYVSGCSMLVKKSVFFNLNCFDDIYSPAFYDDTDFCTKIINAGLKNYVQPKSILYHYQNLSYSTTANTLSKINLEKYKTKWKSYIETKTSYDPNKMESGLKRRCVLFLIIYSKDAYNKYLLYFINSIASRNIVLKCAFNFRINKKIKDNLFYNGIQIIHTVNYEDCLSRFAIDSTIFINNIKLNDLNFNYYFLNYNSFINTNNQKIDFLIDDIIKKLDLTEKEN